MGKKLIDDGGSAFPVPCAAPFGEGHMATGGMSVRVYLAGKALQGYCANHTSLDHESESKAEWALDDADALLKLLKHDSEL